ncbi:hypothetical protein XELAEV_18005515mg [Xenopus laevis]|uniref:Reverse transcriptase domain-containing protein n=1 Tax=Xenopus laevis TaxID=8355 RepID=A0A974DY72_XENLA|nr:hypothetical protein XELAEV_18005515mg [Xenopus laevis]
MGAAVVPSFDNLFAYHLEKQLFLESPFKVHLHGFFRFVDGTLVLWKGPVHLFEGMIQIANQAHNTIKFTTNIGLDTLNFLDVHLKIIAGWIHTSLYRKNTDRNYILHATSFHASSIIITAKNAKTYLTLKSLFLLENNFPKLCLRSSSEKASGRRSIMRRLVSPP